MIEFFLDEQSGVTTYLQLVQQVKDALRLGMLQPGDQLPTAREVVANLAINPNTVMRAYRELELGGLIETHQGTGTFIANKKTQRNDAERERRYDQAVDPLVAERLDVHDAESRSRCPSRAGHRRRPRR